MTDFDNKGLQDQTPSVQKPEEPSPEQAAPAVPPAQEEPAPQPASSQGEAPAGRVPHLTFDPNEADPFPSPPGRRSRPVPSRTISRLPPMSSPSMALLNTARRSTAPPSISLRSTRSSPSRPTISPNTPCLRLDTIKRAVWRPAFWESCLAVWASTTSIWALPPEALSSCWSPSLAESSPAAWPPSPLRFGDLLKAFSFSLPLPPACTTATEIDKLPLQHEKGRLQGAALFHPAIAAKQENPPVCRGIFLYECRS